MSDFFCLTKLKNFVEGRNSVLCFRKFPVAKNFTDKTGGGECQDFPSEFFLSHSTETFRRGRLLCCVSENFWLPKSVWMRGRVKYQEFLRKVFSHSAEKCRRGTV